jgi:hypothetical protein
VQPLRDPERHRAYMWIFGVLLKSAGAVAFLVDHYVNGSPRSFLLFVASDGTVALATLAALTSTTSGSFLRNGAQEGSRGRF